MKKGTRLKQLMALLLVIVMTIPMIAEPLTVRAVSDNGETEISSQEVIPEENLIQGN